MVVQIWKGLQMIVVRLFTAEISRLVVWETSHNLVIRRSHSFCINVNLVSSLSHFFSECAWIIVYGAGISALKLHRICLCLGIVLWFSQIFSKSWFKGFLWGHALSRTNPRWTHVLSKLHAYSLFFHSFWWKGCFRAVDMQGSHIWSAAFWFLTWKFHFKINILQVHLRSQKTSIFGSSGNHFQIDLVLQEKNTNWCLFSHLKQA